MKLLFDGEPVFPPGWRPGGHLSRIRSRARGRSARGGRFGHLGVRRGARISPHVQGHGPRRLAQGHLAAHRQQQRDRNGSPHRHNYTLDERTTWMRRRCFKQKRPPCKGKALPPLCSGSALSDGSADPAGGDHARPSLRPLTSTASRYAGGAGFRHSSCSYRSSTPRSDHPYNSSKRTRN